MMSMFSIREMADADIAAIKAFTDTTIGEGYYSVDEIHEMFQRSQKDGRMYSLVLVDSNDNIKGVRITYPPGQWESGKGHGLTPSLWPHQQSETAYFQSLFLSPDVQGKGLGGQISRRALSRLKELGAKGVVCHSWKESPNNSSTRYLQKLGFKVVKEHLEYWRDVNYQCVKCLTPPCRCTALEMYLDL